ncbi:MAG: hypothetical protein ACM3QW_08760 [Ignavibacteriales bacterium]
MSAPDAWLKEARDKTWTNPRIKILVAIMAVIGMALLLWSPTPTKNSKTTSDLPATQEVNDVSFMEAELDAALAGIDGAGRVKTQISLVSDGHRAFASNERREVRKTQEKDPNGTVRNITEENLEHELVMSNNSPILQESIQPEVAGVLVIADGAADPVVEERLAQAVTGFLNISASRVTVMPMSEGGDR